MLLVSDPQQTFRAALRTWLEDHHPGREPDDEAEAFAFRREWQRVLHGAGWLGLTWPTRYGGRGLSPLESAIFNEELVRARAPRPAGLIGLEMGGPTILSHGSDEQKERFLGPLLAGEEVWCQAFSEPGAGSDLAAIRTVARRQDGDWIVSGQKVWTSFAHEADWCMLLVRTDRGSRGHEGLTYLLLDMHQPGVTVQPLKQITGESEFNEIFLDEARIPYESRLGDVDQGWAVAITTLMHERANLSFTLATDVLLAFDSLVDLARQTPRNAGTALDDALVRDRIAQLRTESEILRLGALRSLMSLADGTVPGAEASLNKWLWAEVNQAVTTLALEITGSTGDLTDPMWNRRFLRARANSIEGGTTEILRNIVAERVLGLQRHS